MQHHEPLERERIVRCMAGLQEGHGVLGEQIEKTKSGSIDSSLKDLASLVDEAAPGEAAGGEAEEDKPGGARVLHHGLRRMNGDEDELCRVKTVWRMD